MAKWKPKVDDKSCSDTARYKALGNGMAQPRADFIIGRIANFFEEGAAKQLWNKE